MEARVRTVFLGASGYCGQQALKALLKNPNLEEVLLISRRELPDLQNLDKKVKVAVVKELQKLVDLNLKGFNSAVMTLGAGKASQVSKEELMRLDAELPILFAKKCKADGIEVFELMTAVGADVTKEWGFITRTGAGGGYYNHVKGLCEEECKKVGFRRLSIFRPAGIIGNPNTGAFNTILPALDWILPTVYNSIAIADLGKAIANRLQTDLVSASGETKVFQGQDLFDLYK